MPNVGDITQGKLIGRPKGRFVWVRCQDCGKERWLSYKPLDPASVRRCHPCHVRYVREVFTLNKAKK
jgi:ribosomal protein S27E